jgi:hypothetical protein
MYILMGQKIHLDRLTHTLQPNGALYDSNGSIQFQSIFEVKLKDRGRINQSIDPISTNGWMNGENESTLE